jgi:hypothetical protein
VKNFKLTLPELTDQPDFLVERSQYDTSIGMGWRMHMWWPCDCCPLIAFCVFSVSCWYLLDRFFPHVKFGQRQQPKDSQNAEFMDRFSFSNSIPFLFDWVYLVAQFLRGHGELVIFAYPETSVALDSNLHSTSSLWSHVLRLLVLCKRIVLSLSRHHISKGWERDDTITVWKHWNMMYMYYY